MEGNVTMKQASPLPHLFSLCQFSHYPIFILPAPLPLLLTSLAPLTLPSCPTTPPSPFPRVTLRELTIYTRVGQITDNFNTVLKGNLGSG